MIEDIEELGADGELARFHPWNFESLRNIHVHVCVIRAVELVPPLLAVVGRPGEVRRESTGSESVVSAPAVVIEVVVDLRRQGWIPVDDVACVVRYRERIA